MNRKSIVIMTAIVIGVIITILVFNKTHTGTDRFFTGDQEYHYMTLRVMGDIPAGGAETGEVLSIISRIPGGDDEKWFFEWNKAASRLEKTGGSLNNPVSRGIARAFIKLKMNTNTTVRWGIHNAQWTLGVDDPVDVLDAMSKFNLADVAEKIRCPVLIVSGEKDHLVPVGQVEELRNRLVNAKSVITRIFKVEEGGAEHCQMGAFSLFHEELFDWLEKVIDEGVRS